MCQFGELWYLCFSWLIGFTSSKVKSVQNFSVEVLYWFRATVGLSHLKIRSWGPLNRFFSTRLPNTDFPVVCCDFVSPGHTSYCQGHIDPFSSSKSSVIRRRRLEAKITYEHWTLVLCLQGISRGLQLSLVFGGLFSSRRRLPGKRGLCEHGTRPGTPGNEEGNLWCKVILQWRSFLCFFFFSFSSPYLQPGLVYRLLRKTSEWFHNI